MTTSSRREFLGQCMLIGGAGVAAGPLGSALAQAADAPGGKMRFGLVTYQWGKDWDLPTLMAHCEQSKVLGVELRTTHKHGVERELNAAQRAEVKKRFDDSPVTLVGIGSNERFDSPDADTLAQALEATKDFIKLSHDVGGSGVKVKPNSFHKGVPHTVTIDQIGKCLNILGAFGADYGQQIRLEVHGECSELPIMAQIMEVAEHPNVAVCWNSNARDLEGEGLEHNFNLVKDRMGDTVHIRDLRTTGYPWQELMGLFVKMDYAGWILLEASTKCEDPVKDLAEQQTIWKKLVAQAAQET